MKERTTDYDLISLCEKLGIPLRGIFSKNELPYKPINGGYIVNLQNSNDGNGTHWSCVLMKPKEAIYFDSFGIPPPWEVMHFCGGKKVKFNDTQLQNIEEAYCGQWVVLFLYYMTTNSKNLKGNPKTVGQRYKAFLDNFRPLHSYPS